MTGQKKKAFQEHAGGGRSKTLDLSLKTARNHVSTIFSKLQVADRAQAILHARAAGFGPEQDEKKANKVPMSEMRFLVPHSNA